jgi:hypothetical protein
MTALNLIPRDLEHWRGRHLQLADLALTAAIADMHRRLAAFYHEQITAIILG